MRVPAGLVNSKSLVKKIILFIATGGGVGYLPKAPGTWGSVVGLLLYIPLSYLTRTSYMVTLVGLIFIAAWVSTVAEALFNKSDSQKIVIDEVVGILVTLALVTYSWKVMILGFLFFRLFDIWKPFPIRLMQDKIPRGWGVVLDDVMAGVYANILLQILCIYFRFS